MPAATAPRVSAKQRLGAACLSALMPGIGQFRLGQTRKASILVGAFLAFMACFWPLRLPRFYAGLMAPVFAGFVLFNFAVFDALFSRDRVSGERIGLVWIPAGALFGYIGFNIVFTGALFGSGFRTVQNVSSSMMPLLRAKDRFVYDRRYYASHPKTRGDVVILRIEKDLVVKRIVAVGGDTIEGANGKILLNGRVLDEPYSLRENAEATDPAMESFGPVTVPSGKYFVMGDNRSVSLDSRSYGCPDDEMVVGKALYYYKIGFGKGPVTWSLN